MKELTGLNQLRYVILHGRDQLLNGLTSDIDMMVLPEDLLALESWMRNSPKGQLVQLLQHESSCFYFVLATVEASKIRFLPVDAGTDYRRDGRVFFTAEELLAGRCQWNGFWVATPRAEFGYLLVKKVLKGAIPDHQKKRFRQLISELGDEGGDIAAHLLGHQWGTRAISWIRSENWNALEANLPRLKKALLWQKVKSDPLNPLRYWIPELRRIWSRWRYPTGLFVAVLGPDGAGKSTLIKNLKENLAGAFRRTAVFHLRPGLIRGKGAGGPVTNPHSKPPHPWWLSLLKIPYYLVEYGLGYLFKVRPRLVRSTLVLFDRYYHDLLVDQRRYRYSGPLWFARLATRFVRRPDLFLILDVPEEQVLTRKREVSREELERQREAYRSLAIKLPNAVLLDGSLPAKEVALHASEVILDYLHQRYLKRRKLWFDSGHPEALNQLSSVISADTQTADFALTTTDLGKGDLMQPDSSFVRLSLEDGRGYLLPHKARRASANALQIYNAHNLKGRSIKHLLKAGLRFGLAQYVLPGARIIVRDNERHTSKTLLLEHLKEMLGCRDVTFAFSMGTPGPHRKPVIQVLTHDGKTLGYAKVGRDNTTNRLVQNEAQVLGRLASVSFSSFIVPELLYSGWWNDRFLCVQAVPDGIMNPAARELNSQYIAALRELAGYGSRWIPLRESAFWSNLLGQIGKVENTYYKHILQQGVCQVERTLGDAQIPFHFCHGDFAPWNAQNVNGSLYLYDWEYAAKEAPYGYDVFHFLFQTHLLLKKQPPGKIFRVFVEDQAIKGRVASYLNGFDGSTEFLEPLFLLYLLERLAFYASQIPINFYTLRCLAAVTNLCLLRRGSP